MKWTAGLLSIFLLLAACRDEGEPVNACSSNFQQEGLFITISSGLIIPGYADLQSHVDAMQASAEIWQCTRRLQIWKTCTKISAMRIARGNGWRSTILAQPKR